MIIGIIAFLYATLKIAHVIILYLQTKPGLVFLGTGQYYLDYYYYVQQIAQGTWGNLYARHYYSTDVLYPILYRQPYVVLGWIASLIRVNPFVMYWLTIFIGSMIIVGCFYYLIKRAIPQYNKAVMISALLISLFATPFYQVVDLSKFLVNINLIWYFPDTFLSRPFNIPHHVIAEVLILFMLIVNVNILTNIDKFSKKTLFKRTSSLTLLLIILAALYPYYVVSYVPVFLLSLMIFIIWRIITFSINKKILINLILSTLFFIFFGLVGSYIVKIFLYSKETAEALRTIEGGHMNIDPKNMILNIGPLMIFAPFGLLPFFKKINTTKIVLFSYVLISYIFFVSNLDQIIGTHNSRFLSPISYLLFGIICALGISIISNIFWKAKKVAFLGITTILLISFIPPNIRTLINTVEDRNINSPISYIPKGTIEGWMLLGQTRDNKVVLTTPSQFLGQVVPIFVNKRVYISRHNETPHYLDKAWVVDRFYRGEMTPIEAHDFLKKNNIGYVLFTSIEGYILSPIKTYKFFSGLFKNYPTVLKELYRNDGIIIFGVK